MNAAMLDEKTQVFTSKCVGNYTWTRALRSTPFCMRRGAQMLQAGSFMAKAQQTFNAESETRTKVEKSLKDLADTVGTEGTTLMMFKDKLISNPAAFLSNPREAASKMGSTVFTLFRGTDEEKAALRAGIEAMPTGSGEIDERQVESIETALKKEENSVNETQLSSAWQAVNSVTNAKKLSNISVTDIDSNASALLELDGQEALELTMLNVVAAIILSILLCVVIGSQTWLVTAIPLISLLLPVMISLILIVGAYAFWVAYQKGSQRSFDANGLHVTEAAAAPKNDGDFWEQFGMKDGDNWSGGAAPSGHSGKGRGSHGKKAKSRGH